MDSELTVGFTEPCSQCEAVDWGVSEDDGFFCRTCHNIIERRNEADLTSRSRDVRATAVRRTTSEPVLPKWSVCEAFQLILSEQAIALVGLGVSPDFKDKVLLQLWRRYLQLSQQAYVGAPLRTFSPTPHDLAAPSDSPASDSDGSEAGESEAGESTAGSCDSKTRRSTCLSMSKTLVLIHLALVWSREALTLSDLLRLVNDGQVPYINAYEGLPEEIQLQGLDAALFRVTVVPSYRRLHLQAQAMCRLLRLPAFPPLDRRALLHPAPLLVRYLAEANLPDELQPWACALAEHADLMKVQTFDPSGGQILPQYDVQAAAILIVTLKLLFALDDDTEWELSNKVPEQDSGVFSFRRWYRVLQGALHRVRQTHQLDLARRQWRSRKLLCLDRKTSVRRTRTAEHIQYCFQKLSSQSAEVQQRPSSFRFLWGDQAGADGPSMHHQRLDPVMPVQQFCWYLKPTGARTSRGDSALEKTLSWSLLWLLRFFCFLLQVPLDLLNHAVHKLERRIFGRRRVRQRSARRVQDQ